MKTPQNSQWIGQSYDVGFRLFHDHGWGGYPFFEQTWWSWNLWLTEKKMQRGREAKRQRVCFRFWFHQQLAFSGSDWDFLVSKLQRNIDPKWVPWHPWHPLVPGRISKGESGNWTLVDLHARQHFRRRGSYLISSQAEEKCHPVAVIMQPWDSWDWSKKDIVHSTCHQGQSHASITSISSTVNDVNGCWVVWVMCGTILAPIPLRNPFYSRFLFQGGEWYTHVTYLALLIADILIQRWQLPS